MQETRGHTLHCEATVAPCLTGGVGDVEVLAKSGLHDELRSLLAHTAPSHRQELMTQVPARQR